MAMVAGSCAWIALGSRLVARAQARVGDRSPRATRIAMIVCAGIAAAIALARPDATRLSCAIASSALVIAAFADARTGLLFDAITFPSAVATGTAAVACGASHAAALGVLVLVGGFGALVAVSRGRLMGLGDVKAMYAIGAAFGPAEALVVVFAACISGIATAVLTARATRGTEVRFGPHLAAGSAFTLVAGDAIIKAFFAR